MAYYPKAKVYSDGSHYIAIPHTEGRKGLRLKRKEPTIIVDENNNKVEKFNLVPSVIITPKGRVLEEVEWNGKEYALVMVKPKIEGRETTLKDLFEEAYKETQGQRKKERKTNLLESAKKYINDEDTAKAFVEQNLERKRNNLIKRRVRLCRKAYLNSMNYFCTFTYDDKLQTEESFKKKFIQTISSFKKRYGWEYLGVWERGKETGRLHFHGLFHIPDGQLRGNVIDTEDYDFKTGKRTVKHQNEYFLYIFGRNDFEFIPYKEYLGQAIAYIIKYLEKDGGKIISSKGLSQYIVSDIQDDDIVCTIGQEDKKLLLFDDFLCIDEGEIKGKVSPDVIKEMPKAN